MALLFVLWLVMILTAVVFEVRYASHLRMQATANLGLQKKALYCARSGIEQAIADLAEERKMAAAAPALGEDLDPNRYCNIAIGEGYYTLYAGADDLGEVYYGPADTCAKLNVNKADAAVLAKIPELEAARAADIIALRGTNGLQSLDELLQIEGVTETTLYGEDPNRNGILDPNENDGDASWPPDNADGVLDAGWSAYLTVLSAARNVTPAGEDRVNLNSADANAIRKAAPELNEKQTAAIVARRDEQKFGSVVELLDVQYYEQVQQPPAQNTQSGRSGRRNASSNPASNPQQTAENAAQQKPTLRKTGEKAIDEALFRRVAGCFTISDDKSTQGLVNINTASANVLACLPGMTQELAEAIVSNRQGLRDRFTSPAELLEVSGMTVDTLRGLYAFLTARSDTYEVCAFGTADGWKSYAASIACVDCTEDTIRIAAWRVLG